MNPNLSDLIASSYRTHYGQLFATLFRQFGARYLSEIEDAIQNAFYKSLRSWKPDRLPDNQANWLFIVARNDLLNQIKKADRFEIQEKDSPTEESPNLTDDLRLHTILYLARLESLSAKAKVIFVLKNIFGLHIKEIHESTLLSEHALYKLVQRSKAVIEESGSPEDFEAIEQQISGQEIALVEEILYAIFNLGFDSFKEKVASTIDEALCLEAVALAKMLLNKFERPSTRNLLALFCFHLARVPAKVKDQKIIPFFSQRKEDWDDQFLQLGFHYLTQVEPVSRYYLEALITSKHMTAETYDEQHWTEIVRLYRLLLPFSDSPILRLNLVFCLFRIGQKEAAMELLQSVEEELPEEHIYLALVRANLLKEELSPETRQLTQQTLRKIKQEIRKEYISEHFFSDDPAYDEG
ncbi:MAG: DUF6596 domain-containing protein [Bacteroidota bacterium]